jgi:hypothetical protein
MGSGVVTSNPSGISCPPTCAFDFRPECSCHSDTKSVFRFDIPRMVRRMHVVWLQWKLSVDKNIHPGGGFGAGQFGPKLLDPVEPLDSTPSALQTDGSDFLNFGASFAPRWRLYATREAAMAAFAKSWPPCGANGPLRAPTGGGNKPDTDR